MSSTETYSNILTKGLQSQLDSAPIEDGKLRYTTDTGRLYLDLGSGSSAKRLKISDIEDTLTEEEIFNLMVPLPKVYISKDTHRAYVNNGSEIIDLAAITLHPSDIVDLDVPVWFSALDGEKPLYAEEFTYNTGKKALKVTNIVSSTVTVNGMIITDVLNDDGVTHTVEFSFN